MALEAGAKLGPYEIIELLGTGGMGEVYRARDPRLGRDVAVKVVRSELGADKGRLRRLEQEARAAGALNHPNILAVYDVGTYEGTPYVVSELLEGHTLRTRLEDGALPVRKALDYATQIARGLTAAHARKIVHRDLKPENVFVTEDGRVKILDFGLATHTRPDSQAADARSTATDAGVVVGTAGYMSPEQVRGEVVDHRSDLFSFGTVLYEMLAGERAFRRDSGAETHAAILRDDPPAVSESGRAIPPGLERILHRSLEKRPGDRFQSSHDLALALEAASLEDSRLGWLRPGVPGAVAALGVVGLVVFFLLRAVGLLAPGPPDTPAPIPTSTRPPNSVAVLPFENVGGDPELEYLSDGVAETLINNLTRLDGLRVVPRTLVFPCKREAIDGVCDALQIGRQHGVRAVVTGRVLARGDTLTIGVELIDVTEAAQMIWGERFEERPAAEALPIVDAIAREIGSQLGVEPSGELKTGTKSAEAYDLYLKGLHGWNQLSFASMSDAITYFQHAAAADPGYALPHLGLANVYSTIGYAGLAMPRDVWPKVKAEAQRALELDETLAGAHAALGHAVLFLDWDWPAAKRSLDQAVALDAYYAPTYHWYAHYWAVMGDMEKALEDSRRAVELAPYDMLLRGHEFYFLAMAGRGDELADRCAPAAEKDPSHWTVAACRGLAQVLQGRLPEAIGEFELAVERSDRHPMPLGNLGTAYAAAGRREDAEGVIADLLGGAERQGYTVSAQVAAIHGVLGNVDEAFNQLEAGYRDRHPYLLFLKVFFSLDSLREDPRFDDLVRRVGLP